MGIEETEAQARGALDRRSFLKGAAALSVKGPPGGRERGRAAARSEQGSGRSPPSSAILGGCTDAEVPGRVRGDATRAGR